MRALVSRQFLSAAPLTEYAASVKGAPTNPTSEQRPSVSFRSRRSVSPVNGNDAAGSWRQKNAHVANTSGKRGTSPISYNVACLNLNPRFSFVPRDIIDCSFTYIAGISEAMV